VKRKVKNNQEEYISRASLHHPQDAQILHEESVESKTSESERYFQAKIEEDWYINFKVDVNNT
jgi:hypothetical protein